MIVLARRSFGIEIRTGHVYYALSVDESCAAGVSVGVAESRMKTIEQHFADWESDTFGFGYGSGEVHVLGALRAFLAAIPETGTYDYAILEQAVTAPVTWLLINVLAHEDMIEYGTSPRYGWLTSRGRALAEFTAARSVDQLVSATDQGDEGAGYVHCYPKHCNCDDGDCRPLNPFWQNTR